MKQLWTKWGEHLNKESVLQAYPREQLRRTQWINLNGFWDYAFTDTEQKEIPSKWDGKILVPFSPETALSGVGRQLQPNGYLWYKKSLAEAQIMPVAGEKLLLHFGAVDQSCIVYLNGLEVGNHTGGYLPFTMELTDALQEIHSLEQEIELVVRVRDLSDTSYHARGKQKLKNGGMYYTAQSGIWQSVWLEKVPQQYITRIIYLPDLASAQMNIQILTNDPVSADAKITVYEPKIFTADEAVVPDRDAVVCTECVGKSNKELQITLPQPKRWNCDEPWLYPVRIEMDRDCVYSYFALREIRIRPDQKHIPRIYLNEEELYMKGVLDQGYWPESLMTPPSEEALIFDLTEMKQFGFNMVRKHCKIEPDLYYSICDKIGLLVWQDMINGGTSYKDWFVTYAATVLNWMHIPIRDNHANLLSRAEEAGKREFKEEMRREVEALHSHPSIIAWTIFNEAWGQFETIQCTELLRSLDQTRLIDSASGWFDQKCGDLRSVHYYFLTFRMDVEKKRAFVLSEYGGLPMFIKEHCASEQVYGYGKRYETIQELSIAYHKLVNRMEAHVPDGMCATVYTQWSDIEDEVNGIYTWDRKVKKIQIL